MIYVHQENMDDLVNTWNRNRKNNNCYAFAFDHLNPGATDKLQPGELSGMPPLEDDQYTCEALNNRVLTDNPGTKLSSSGQCLPGYRAVALFVDNTGENRDYHFYRQMDNCTTDGDLPGEQVPCVPGQTVWAHKPGSRKVSFIDDSGQVITDPRMADRDYVNGGDEMSAFNYDKFCTFFCVPNPNPSLNNDDNQNDKATNNNVSQTSRVQWWLFVAAIIVLIGIAHGMTTVWS